jgi:hypothetical protein
LEDLDDEGGNVESDIDGFRKEVEKIALSVKEVTGEMSERLDEFAEKFNDENDDEEEKSAYREMFSGLLSGLANRFIGGIDNDYAFDNFKTAFGDVQYVLEDLFGGMKEEEKEKWAPLLNVVCDLALDFQTDVENKRQCYRLMNKLIERCKFNAKKLGDEVLLDCSSNNGDDKGTGGSQRNHSRLKRLGREFEIGGDFECQKEIVLIAIHLLHGGHCNSFDPTTEHGMKTIKTFFPNRSEEIVLLQKTLAKLGDGQKSFPLVVDFVRQSNALLGSKATVFSYECEEMVFGEYGVADNLVHFSKYSGFTLNVRLDKDKEDATAVDIVDQNIRVAKFDCSTNTLTIGIYEKCEGMLEEDEVNTKDDSWISLRFKAEDVPGVKSCIRMLAESGKCKAMEKLRVTLDASAGKKTSRGVEVTYDLHKILTQPESTTELIEPIPLPRNPTAMKDLTVDADEEHDIATKPTAKSKASKKKSLPTPPLSSHSPKPVRAAKAKANSKIAAQNAAYQSALKEKENAERIIVSSNEAKKTQKRKMDLRDIFNDDKDRGGEEEEDYDVDDDDAKSSLLDQTDESLEAGDEDGAKIPSFEDDMVEDAPLEKKPKKRTNERVKDINTNYNDTKTPKATIKVPQTAPLRKPEKSTVRFAPPTKDTTSRGKKAALAQATAKNKEGWREKMSNLTNTLHVHDDEEENIVDEQLGKSGRSEKETLSYNKAKVERRLKFSTGKKPDEASTLKRKNRGDDDNDDDFAFRGDDDDDDDDEGLFFSSQNESDERGKKRVATASKVIDLKSSDEDFGAEEDEEEDEEDDLPSAAAAENQFDAIKNAMETLRRTKTREAESKVQKLSKTLEMDFEKASSKLSRDVSENVQTAKRSIDDTAHQLEKEEQKILARLDDITKKFTRDFERERDLLLAVKSKGKAAYKNANAVVKAVVEEANDEWNTLQAKMREKSAKLKRECKRIRRECAEQTDLKKMLLNMAEMI